MTELSVFHFFSAARRIGGELGVGPIEDALLDRDLATARRAAQGLRRLGDSEAESIEGVMRSTAVTARDLAAHAVLFAPPATRPLKHLWTAIAHPVIRCSMAVVMAWLVDPQFDERGLIALQELTSAKISRPVRDELGATLSELLFEPVERQLNRTWLSFDNADFPVPPSRGERALVFLNRIYWRLEELGELDSLGIRQA